MYNESGQTFLSFDLTNVTSERAAAGANKQSYDNGTCTVPSVIQISISLILHQHSVQINQGMFRSPTSNMPSLYSSQISHTQNDDQPQEAHQACKEVAKSSCLEKENHCQDSMHHQQQQHQWQIRAILLSTQLIKGGNGPITLPCDVVFIEYAVSLIQGCVDRHLQEALVMFIASSRCSLWSHSHHHGQISQPLLVSSC
ncbi:hypothetical protein Q3G72_006377 [Acer saccharum]|nr:hypothetical protein Q3G72_006377 [Acer saccharum]